MTWITFIDARSGEHLAVPAAATSVSFDMRTHREFIEQAMEQVEQQSSALSDLAETMKEAGVPQAFLTGMEHGRATDKETVADLRRRLGIVEAVMVFNERVYLAREIAHTTQWADVVTFTRRPAGVKA